MSEAIPTSTGDSPLKKISGLIGNSILPLSVISLLGIMLVPIPPVALDFFLVLSIATSLATLIIAIGTKDPMSFNVFPSLLLVLTLYRLGLNIASTRLILTTGPNAKAPAGNVIDSFGNFVVGGNYVVGMIIFFILLIVNFIVITKGSGRIAEVTARFTLDAMPGKQMAIDADLNAGLIDDKEALERRDRISQEADFYGAMDGSSKFVRGDAIAGLIITGINVIGGFVIGVFQHDMKLSEAATHYTLLSIGDGLVTQIPALIISLSAGMVVTRVAKGSSLTTQLAKQLVHDKNALYMAAGVVAFMGLMPGLPAFPFLAVALGTALASWMLQRNQAKEIVEEGVDLAPEAEEEAELAAELVIRPLALTVGFDLVPLLDPDKNGDLPDRIGALRRRLAGDLGIIIPSIHVSDDPTINGGEYVIHLNGNPIGRGEIFGDRYLAMDPTGLLESLPGIRTKDPTFGLPAIWITESERDAASLSGYTVVPPSAVVTTHLSELIRRHADELLTRDELQRLFDNVAQQHPKTVKDLIPDTLPMTTVLTVCRNLLRERIPVKDLATIADALSEAGSTIKDPIALTEHVRHRLSRTISARLTERDGTLPVAVVDPIVEEMISGSSSDQPAAGMLETLSSSLTTAAKSMADAGHSPVIVVSSNARPAMRTFVDRLAPGTHVISYDEIADPSAIRTVERIALNVGTT